jgi:hypothetical protein
VAHLGSELGIGFSPGGFALCFLVQPAYLRLELGNRGEVQEFLLARLVEHAVHLSAGVAA